MRTIIRCPACFTYVYSDARRCHGCGERIGKRKILRRGSWVFIVLAVAGFTVARGIDLHQEGRDRSSRQLKMAGEMAAAKSFLRSWLASAPDELEQLSEKTEKKTFGSELAKLREKFPRVLPATSVPSIKISDERWLTQYHEQKAKGPVVHTRRDGANIIPVSAPRCGLAAEIKTKFSRAPWSTHAYEFEADFVTDDHPYTAYGQVCIDDSGKVCCFVLDRIEDEGVEGGIVVKPR